MALQDIRYDQHFEKVMKAMTSGGLLLASRKPDGTGNAMAIGWGLMGSVWGRPIWAVLVRPSRYTHGLIEQTDDFTVNVPGPDLAKACALCGSVSGRGRDKLAEAGLRTRPARQVRSPIIDGCIIYYECQVLHKNDVQPGALVQAIVAGAYPSGDFHRVYWGQIVAAYAEVDRLAEL